MELRSPTVCNMQAGDPVKLGCNQSKSKDLRIRVTDSPLGLRAWEPGAEDWCSSVSSQGGGDTFFLLPFVLFRASMGWMVPTHSEEASLLYLLYQLKC